MNPTKYKPEYDKTIVEIMTNGDGWAQFCKEVQISMQTMDVWVKNEPSFREAYFLGYTYSLAWWENHAKVNLANPKFNGFVWQRMMFNKFKKYYVEKGREIQMEGLQELLRDNPDASFEQQAAEIVKDMANGRMTVEEADKATSVIRGYADIKKVSELEDMVEDITDAMKKQGKL